MNAMQPSALPMLGPVNGCLEPKSIKTGETQKSVDLYYGFMCIDAKPGAGNFHAHEMMPMRPWCLELPGRDDPRSPSNVNEGNILQKSVSGPFTARFSANFFLDQFPKSPSKIPYFAEAVRRGCGVRTG
jgi:hypothetical protein